MASQTVEVPGRAACLAGRVGLATAAAAGLLLLVASGVRAQNGGETAGGYRWTDSRLPGPSATFRWVEISAGQPLPEISDCDDCTLQVPIGFSFQFYGKRYQTVYINANGALQFEDAADHWGPGRMPTPDFSGPVILPFWSDWDTRASGAVYAKALSEWPAGSGHAAFVVQWQNVENWDCGRGDNATWQVILLEGGDFVFQYLDTAVADPDCNGGLNMTVGIQQDTDACFVVYSNQYFALRDQMSIEWTPAGECLPASEPEAGPAPQPDAGPAGSGPATPPLLKPPDRAVPEPTLRQDGSGVSHGRREAADSAHFPATGGLPSASPGGGLGLSLSLVTLLAGAVLASAGAGLAYASRIGRACPYPSALQTDIGMQSSFQKKRRKVMKLGVSIGLVLALFLAIAVVAGQNLNAGHDERIKLEGRLSATSADPLASGKAKWEQRLENATLERRRISVEVEDLSTTGAHAVRIFRNGGLVAEVTVSVDALGFGDFNADTRDGDTVAVLQAGDTVRVFNPGDVLILEGTLQPKD